MTGPPVRPRSTSTAKKPKKSDGDAGERPKRPRGQSRGTPAERVLSASLKTTSSIRSLSSKGSKEKTPAEPAVDVASPPPPPVTLEPDLELGEPANSDTFESPSRQMSISFFDRYASKIVANGSSEKPDSRDRGLPDVGALLHASSISGLSSELVNLRKAIKTREAERDTAVKQYEALKAHASESNARIERDGLLAICGFEETEREAVTWAYSQGLILLARAMSQCEPVVNSLHAVEINEIVHDEWTDRNKIEKLCFAKFTELLESTPLIKNLTDMAHEHLLSSHVADMNCKLSRAETDLVRSEQRTRKLQTQLKHAQRELQKKEDLLNDIKTTPWAHSGASHNTSHTVSTPTVHTASHLHAHDTSITDVGNSISHSLSDYHGEGEDYSLADARTEWARAKGDRSLSGGRPAATRYPNTAAAMPKVRSFDSSEQGISSTSTSVTRQFPTRSPPFANTRLHAFMRSRSAVSRPTHSW
eukprot:TRINITY_DN14959_c0_g7_i1.p1 TRINITY_DN14959_c0_g7~~TRINITY_DN14959_c0_g7_i1.p1  ORF type:complete len:476 (+),score=137.35 TRINITY_DN14959_c0_g7_i1:41-1468(+)